MRVTNIDVNDQRFDGTTHTASVSMELQSGDRAPVNVHFLCRADQEADCPSTLVLYDLLQDALRQARRMPGFRVGEEDIQVDISTATITAA